MSRLAEAVRDGYVPSLAAASLATAHQHMDQDELEEAFIEGITALELAVSEFMRRRLSGNQDLLNLGLGSIKTKSNRLDLRKQVVIIAASVGGIPTRDIAGAVDAINTRNEVIHDGITPPQSAKAQLHGLFRTIAALLPGPAFKFPTGRPINLLMSPEEWAKAQQ